MDTLSKLRMMCAAFATKFGLENWHTIRLYTLYEDTKKFMRDGDIDQTIEELFTAIVNNHTEMAKNGE